MLALLSVVLYSHSTFTAHINDTDTRGFVPEPPGRGTIGILWSCLATLSICLWTSLHLNVPKRTSGSILRRQTLKKLKYMITTAIAPEIVASFALDQNINARSSLKKINALHESEGKEGRWTMMDAFYAEMNGYVLDIPGRELVPVHIEDIINLVQKGCITLPPSNQREIEDKSKADSLAKMLACIQALWMLVSCLARAIQHLPLTTLELGTIGYVFLTAIVYICLWHKPLDIQVPTTLTLIDKNSQSEFLQSSSFAYNTNGTAFDPKISFLPDYIDLNMITFPLIATLHALWHCLAWNFYFPSHAELLLWRVCAVLTTVSFPLGFLCGSMSDHHDESSYPVLHRTLIVVVSISVILYPIARATIIVEMFIDLRSLPSGAFETVEWTDFIPHL